ncbi:MAG: type II toxin-antitoxin system Phd/YefM family antitoxin [Prevotellaceae bacterium]|jgi:antitoxin (DNA-binding transcriptional repressor) of toxin-antitoxin stability system|nr:type II toxin-antitoxin system Phd/YefM family antitoxin [Prevotellaceae bacterium]
MLVISSREFRANQKSYFDQIDAGAEVLVQRRNNKSYRIIPVTEDDTVMNKQAFYEMLEKSLQQIRRGESVAVKTDEELRTLLDSL